MTTKANTDLLGAVGQVAGSSAKTVSFTVKELCSFLIIGGSILVLISAIAVFALVGGKGKDVAGSADAGSEKAEFGTKVTKTQEGMTYVFGPFSEGEMGGIAMFGVKPILQQKTMDDRILGNTNFDWAASSAKYLTTERGVDENGVNRKIHVVEVHLVGDYYSNIDNMSKSLDVTFIAHVLKIDYGRGFKILSTDVVNLKTEAM